jgi:hypothetical protein
MKRKTYARAALLTAAALLTPASIDASPPPRSEPGLGAALHGTLPPPLRQLAETDFVRMFAAIVSGEPPDAGHGWFGPSASRYGWKWLAARCDKDKDGTVTRAEFDGTDELFERLDRDHDGKITAADFDWSDDAPFVRQMETAERWFRRADGNSDGRLTAAEWQALFKEMGKGKEALTPEDLRAWLYPPPPKGPPPPGAGMPTPLTLLAGLVTGEIGSPYPGPRVGDVAPDFRLPTEDGARHFSLRQFRGKRPVVLIFGSFT